MSAERMRKDAGDLQVRAEIERAKAAAWAGVAHGLALQEAEPAAVLAALGIMDRHQERGDRWARKAQEWLQQSNNRGVSDAWKGPTWCADEGAR